MNTINTIVFLAAISALGGCDGPGEVAVPLDGVYPPIGEPPTVSLVESGTNPSPVRYELSAVGAQAFTLKGTFNLNTGYGSSNATLALDITSDGTRTATPRGAASDEMHLDCVLRAPNIVPAGSTEIYTIFQTKDGSQARSTDVHYGRLLRLSGVDKARIETQSPSNEADLIVRNASLLGCVPWPEAPIGIGGTWNTYSSYDIMGVRFRMAHQYKLLSLDKGTGTVAVTMRGVGDKTSANVRLLGKDSVSISGDAEGEGSIHFDLRHPEACTITYRWSCELRGKVHTLDATIRMAQTLTVLPDSKQK